MTGNDSDIISVGGETDDVSVQNISTVLLQPIIRQQDLMTELMLALDLYYTPGIIALGKSFATYWVSPFDFAFALLHVHMAFLDIKRL